jgi:hypothetical protein
MLTCKRQEIFVTCKQISDTTAMKDNKEYQRAYRERMARDFERFILYIPKDDFTRLLELAKRKEWISKAGRKAGAPNIQDTLAEVLRAGLVPFNED